MSSNPESAYGGARVSLQMLAKPGKLNLVHSIAWSHALMNWPHPLQQHDAGEYVNHVLTLFQPSAYRGEWQARHPEAPHRVCDSGQLTAPLLIHLTGDTLPDLIASWHNQYATHALHWHSGLLLLRLVRYGFDQGEAYKNRAPVYVQPGETVAMPVFEGAEGLSVRHEAFRVVFQLFHIGERVDSGHYQCAISVPDSNMQSRQRFYICNDNTTPKRATPRDLTQVATNSYLIGLIRSN